MKKSRMKRIPKELEDLIDKRVAYTGNTFTEEARNLVAIHHNLERELKMDITKIPVAKVKGQRRPIFPDKKLFRLI